MQFDVDPNRRREMHAAIHDEAKRLARMIDDYLDITKLESGVGPLQLRPVQLPPLLDRAVLLLEPLAAKRGIVVVRRFSGELPLVLANPDLMSRAMTNLIANAIKYSPRSTEVTVTVRADAGLVGPGIWDSAETPGSNFREVLSCCLCRRCRNARHGPRLSDGA
jgi:signal transduction histidine kinase